MINDNNLFSNPNNNNNYHLIDKSMTVFIKIKFQIYLHYYSSCQ